MEEVLKIFQAEAKLAAEEVAFADDREKAAREIAAERLANEYLLEIPAFLRRPLPEGSTLMEQIRKSAKRGTKKPKLKIARHKAADTVMLYLSNEAPRIGCGFRPVEVLSRGPKWTTVRYRCAGMNVKHKFKNAVFDRARAIGEKK